MFLSLYLVLNVDYYVTCFGYLQNYISKIVESLFLRYHSVTLCSVSSF